jgi:hypothetical protein
VRSVLARFTDLPHVANEETRDLEMARHRIAELESQLHAAKSEGAAKAIDQATIAEAVSAAVHRERLAWQRETKRDYVRMRQISEALAATGQSLSKLNALFEEAERAWLVTSSGAAALKIAIHNRSARSKTAANGRAVGVTMRREPPKLGNSERHILISLALYPEARSKLQLALLTGYAAIGGGFNKYLGALRSRGFIEGDGERLMISMEGSQALGLWEPLAAGASPIDYRRGRLCKAERLILRALAQAYPDSLSKQEVAAKAGYEMSGGRFNRALVRLKTLGLVQGRGELRVSRDLFNDDRNPKQAN